jgi:hypothetical protein
MPGMDRRRILPLVATLAAGIAAVVVSSLLWDDGSNASGVDWSRVEELPAPKFEDHRSELVSDEEGYRFHPRSGRVTPTTAYRFDTGHCGLSFLADFDGSFWRPIDPDGGEPPDFFVNHDVGAIALVDFDRAIYRSSAGVEVALERIRGPVVSQPCS